MICSVERFVSIIVAAITGPLNPLPAKKYPVAVSVLSVPLALYQAIANPLEYAIKARKYIKEKTNL